MLFRKTTLVIASACALAGGASAAQDPGAASAGTVVRTQDVDTQSMQRLRQAADRLRESIQVLAQQAPGPQRDRAIADAHRALLRTQQAMMDLPPHLRSSGSVSTAGYDESVKKLMKSADSLRQAIQEMAQHPAGEGRNQAIRDASKALWDTQAAMIAAYQPGSTSQAMGASGTATASTSRSGGGTAQRDQQVSGARSETPAALLVLLPAAQAQGTQLANGCWVRFFDDKGFQGDTLTLAGPVDIPRMELGNAWRDWDSAIVGPKATVRTYDNENFRDRTAVLQAGRSIRDLQEDKLGWFDEVKSARVACG